MSFLILNVEQSSHEHEHTSSFVYDMIWECDMFIYEEEKKVANFPKIVNSIHIKIQDVCM